MPRRGWWDLTTKGGSLCRLQHLLIDGSEPSFLLPWNRRNSPCLALPLWQKGRTSPCGSGTVMCPPTKPLSPSPAIGVGWCSPATSRQGPNGGPAGGWWRWPFLTLDLLPPRPAPYSGVFLCRKFLMPSPHLPPPSPCQP